MKDTLDYLEQYTDGFKPEIGLILGSGLGELANSLCEYAINYSDIPGFPKPTVEGHNGKLVFAHAYGHPIVMMQGRCHYYEGYSMQEITYPIKVMRAMGVEKMIITNAAGAINKSFRPGDFMAITDHINFMGNNPLIGKNDDSLGKRFPDMTEVYDKNYIKLIDAAAKKLDIELKRGVYLATTGPSYETPAEVKMFRNMGADALGMSTIPEAIVAHYCGMRVAGISCITNYASGVSSNKLSHNEVILMAANSKNKFIKLILTFIKHI